MTKRTRRRFLEESMLAATAALAVGPGSQVLAADKEETASSSPNERLACAVIGVRGRGGSHVSALEGRDGRPTEITYICDADEDVGKKVCQKIGKVQGREPKFVRDMREVFDDKSVDIVSTATPNHWHALCSIWAMQAGKDVYVEKPVSHNVSEGRRMVEAARKYDRICQTGTQCRSNKGGHALIDYIKSEELGPLKVARGLCYKRRRAIGGPGEFTPPPSVDYNLWCGPAPMNPLTRPSLHYDWHWMWDYGNGDLGNQGIHQMDIARWGLGADELCQGVLSYGGRFGYTDAGETANTQVIIHDYGDKQLVFEVRGLETPPLKGADVGVIFECEKGYAVMTSYDRSAAFDLDGKMIKEFSGGGDHFGNFLSAVRSRKHEDLNADILEGHLSSALCHLGNISYRLGEEVSAQEVSSRLSDSKEALDTFARFNEHLEANGVKMADTKVRLGLQLAFDPKSETFTSNDAANAMLTRDYRAPFVVPAAGQV
ncbi:MAG: Gfo/Idh/MocA family oxidoreductase [Pirellulales bacterium]|nr:Gfo/Idh/MocA family oxidoreductase [Pirellulales bacterium]